MIRFLRETRTGPGFVIPVFFLSFGPLQAQYISPEAAQDAPVTGCGGCYMTRQGIPGPNQNQAGLGSTDSRTVWLTHTRPFQATGLGISSLAATLPVERGTFGVNITTAGLPGFRQTSSWLSFGMKLHPTVAAGIGFHLCWATVADRWFFHPGISLAAGIQLTVGDRIVLGGHVLHPGGWWSEDSHRHSGRMKLSFGGSYTFFFTNKLYAEIQVWSGSKPRMHQGVEFVLPGLGEVSLGYHTGPFTVSCGISLIRRSWNICLATGYTLETGTRPSVTLGHDW